LARIDVGLFAPGTPMATDIGIEVTRRPDDFEKKKRALVDAGYQGERVVVLACSTIPSIYVESQVVTDVLRRIGMNLDVEFLEWGRVVSRRASRAPLEKGGWSIFFTSLGGIWNTSPGSNVALRANGADAWFGWPEDRKIEALREKWFDAPDLPAQQAICREMQAAFWQNPSYVPLGLWYQPTGFRSDLQDVRDGWPQFYGVRRV
jgi:peptide/nickel transport system substrate-binding protein